MKTNFIWVRAWDIYSFISKYAIENISCVIGEQ